MLSSSEVSQSGVSNTGEGLSRPDWDVGQPAHVYGGRQGLGQAHAPAQSWHHPLSDSCGD